MRDVKSLLSTGSQQATTQNRSKAAPLAFSTRNLKGTPRMSMLLIVFAVQVLAVAASWLLRRQEKRLQSRLPYLVSMAVGVLVATAFLHLLP